MVPLKNVGASTCQVDDNLQLTCMSSQMQRRPLLNTARNIQIKWSQITLIEHLIQLNNRIDSLFLSLSDSCVQRSPMIVVLLVDTGAIQSQKL